MDITNAVCKDLYLPHRGVLLPKSDDDDAVSLADAALGPGCERAVGLVQDNTMYVLLLAQPTRQPVLVHTVEGGMHQSFFINNVSANKNPRKSNLKKKNFFKNIQSHPSGIILKPHPQVEGQHNEQAITWLDVGEPKHSFLLLSTQLCRHIYIILMPNLSNAAEPNRCLIMSLVRRSVGPSS